MQFMHCFKSVPSLLIIWRWMPSIGRIPYQRNSCGHPQGRNSFLLAKMLALVFIVAVSKALSYLPASAFSPCIIILCNKMFLSLKASRSIRKWRGTEGFQGFTVDSMDQYNIQQMKPKTLPSDYAGLGGQTYETEMCIQRKNWSICWYTKWLLHFAAIGMAPGFRFLCLYKLVIALSLLWVEQSILRDHSIQAGSGQGSVKENAKCGCVQVGVEYCGPYKTWPFW